MAKPGFCEKPGFAIRLFLMLCLLTALAPGPAAAQGCADRREIKQAMYEQGAAPRPAAEPTAATPVVRVVLFWAEGCGHCEEVLDGALPALQRQHPAQVEARLVEVVSLEDVSAFFAVAEGYGYPRGKAAVPFLLVGDRALMGVEQIERELPALVAELLAAGGADWPAQASSATGNVTVLADDVCGFTAPCEDSAAEAQPAGVILAGLGLAAAASIGLAGLLWGRARRKLAK